MQQSYYKYDIRALTFKYGTPEHKFYDYLIRKENYSRLKGLPIGQVEITIRTVAKDIDITEMVARRLINQFIENDFIEVISKSPKGSKKPSIYMLKTYKENNTDNNADRPHETTQKNESITDVKDVKQHRQTTENNTDNNASKIDNINRIKNNKVKKEFLDTSNEYRLSMFLLNHIRKNNPNSKEPNIQNWCKQFDYIIRLDKRNIEEIKEVIKWCQNNSFWNSNILSPKKLREKYDTLYMQMKNNKDNEIKEQKREVNLETNEQIKKQAEKDLAAILGR